MEMELLLCFPSWLCVNPLLFYLIFLIHRNFPAYPMKLPFLKSCWWHLPSKLYYCILADGVVPRMVWDFDSFFRKPSLLSHHPWPSLFSFPASFGTFLPSCYLLYSSLHLPTPSFHLIPHFQQLMGLKSWLRDRRTLKNNYSSKEI